ncbi:glycine--tRNA ligase [bacterium]|nr:glycine--tRNA ligase [bacterium]
MDKLGSLCKRRGIIFQSSEIYGGINGCWDFGPLGVELRKNIKDHWWRRIVREREDVEGLDASIIMDPAVWKASGHVDSFTDPLVDCKVCKHRFRADQLETMVCPDCGGELTEKRNFNLMFKTFVGAIESEASTVYLRPETAQAIYVNFKNVLNSSRQRIPFGIAQIGKAFRNEINPRNFIFRSREFEQMELQYFINPKNADESFEYWISDAFEWFQSIGIKKENLRLRKHNAEELAHYARKCVDFEYKFPFGWQELAGIHDRTDFDLRRHIEVSGKDLYYFDDITKEKYIPNVIETSEGVDRTLLTILVDAYEEEEEDTKTSKEGDMRVILKFHKRIAPVKVGIFPLSKKQPLVEICKRLEVDLRKEFVVIYDQTGSIGRRYRRQDEIGTPYCITVDFDTVDPGSEGFNSATIRIRDTMSQVRINVDNIKEWIRDDLES